ncbi:MAG: thioredoxin-dependent thiol peroxidase [Candidatus Kapabacteria bacterium]|nr:thioredoxin-dependent thiol peroxidase [Candidatus Kapabacteria bacterium]
MALVEKTKAPSFQGDTDGSGSFSSKDLKGLWTVLYFYPKDDTSGCTAQACDFRDSMNRLKRKGVQVVGVSPDTVAKHEKFKTKYELNFPLIADPDHTICEAFQVWKEKSMYGRKYMGVERTTFVIDPKGSIAKVFEKVKVPGHVEAIMTTLAELSK